MKVIAIILSALTAGAIVITVAINIHTPVPDNSKALEMQRKDIAAERKAIEEAEKAHPNPFEKDIEAMRARGAGQIQSSPLHWGGDRERK